MVWLTKVGGSGFLLFIFFYNILFNMESMGKFPRLSFGVENSKYDLKSMGKISQAFFWG